MDFNLKEMIEYPKQGILSKSVLKNEKLDVTLFCIAGGGEIDEHTSTKRGIVYVLEGEGEFILDGKVIEMKEGVMIYMRENVIHSIKTNKDTSFLLELFT